MSVRIGIYDFFAHTIPGGFYGIIVVYLLHTIGFITIDINSINLSFTHWIIFAFSAYISTLIIDPLSHTLWARFFRPENNAGVELDKFKNNHRELRIDFKSEDWPILLAYIQKEKIEMADVIEKYNATQIMLRNVSFGFLLLVLVEGVQLVQSPSLAHISLGVMFLLFSIMSMRQSVKFGNWFYSSMYETIVAYTLNPSELVSRNEAQR